LRKRKITKKVKRKTSKKSASRKYTPKKALTRKRKLTFEKVRRSVKSKPSRYSTRPTESRALVVAKPAVTGNFLQPKNAKAVQKHTVGKRYQRAKSRLNKGKGLLKSAKKKVDLIAKAIETTGDFAGKYSAYVTPEFVAGVGQFSPAAGIALGTTVKTAGIIEDTAKAISRGLEHPIPFARDNKRAALTSSSLKGFREGERLVREIDAELVQLEHGNYPMLMGP